MPGEFCFSHYFRCIFLLNNFFRFDCKLRTYRYFFPRGDMNIDAMKEACKQLIGIHDYRNFCKMDVANGVVAFIREIKNADIFESNISSQHSSKTTTIVL